MRASLLPLFLIVFLAGCATTETHDSKVATSVTATTQGNVEGAIQQIDAQLTGNNKTDLLLNMEKGELMRIAARYQDSQAAFDIADAKVKDWEENAKNNPAKLMSQVGAVLLGDASRDYEGQDYEKVMLTTRMAMNRINLGDLDTARVDIKRTHEREAVIAEFRAKETAQAEQDAKDKGIKVSGKELNGYPTETLNDPEVLKLKNGFQNAFSHYLAGFVYEALNEPGLAAPGYRKAIELRPDLPVLEEGLRGLDQRTSFRRKKGMTDVLFVVESGNAPARQSKKVAFPVPTPSGLITVSFSFPVIYPDRNSPYINQINLGSQNFQTALVTDFNVMARRALKDDMPGIQARAAIRAIGKAVIQDQVNKNVGGFAALLTNVAAAATEPPADDRMWRSLPDRVFIARGFVAPGEYDLRVPGQPGVAKKIKVDGRYMVVPIRLFKDTAYYGQVAQFGKIDAASIAAADVVKPAKAPKKKTSATITKTKAPAQ